MEASEGQLSTSNVPKLRKRPKKGDPKPIPPPPDGWDRCHAFLKKKQRYCHQYPNADSSYCGNHQELANANNEVKDDTIKRIPCPIDGSHYIREDQMERHIKICPAMKLIRQLEQQPYHRKGFNAGGHGDLGGIGSNQSATTTDQQITNPEQLPILEGAKMLALQILAAHQRIFAGTNLTHAEVTQLRLKDIEEAIPLNDFSGPELDAGLSEAIESYRIRSGGKKHMQQQASLLGHLRKLESLPTLSKNHQNGDSHSLLKSSQVANNHQKTVLLELGAGRGMAGLIAAGAFVASGVKNTSLIMVEKAVSRSKAETILRNHISNLEGKCLDIENVHDFLRIQCDLADVHMPTVLDQFDEKSRKEEYHTSEVSPTSIDTNTPDEVQSPASKKLKKKDGDKIVVALAKHLCGAGTDLALKALYPIRKNLDACLFATCCHGVCNWDDYVGREYLRQGLNGGDDCNDTKIHFGKEEFELMRSWSTGTVISNESFTNTSPKAKKIKSDISEQGAILAEQDDDCEHSASASRKRENQAALGVIEVVRALNLSCGVQGLGRACQRLIDYGRREYLRNELFAVSEDDDEACHQNKPESAFVDLCYYVPADVTPQNAVLLAKR